MALLFFYRLKEPFGYHTDLVCHKCVQDLNLKYSLTRKERTSQSKIFHSFKHPLDTSRPPPPHQPKPLSPTQNHSFTTQLSTPPPSLAVRHSTPNIFSWSWGIGNLTMQETSCIGKVSETTLLRER